MVLAIAGGIWFTQYRRLRHANLPTSSYARMFQENVWLGFGLLLGMIGGLLR
jgi:4-hydroxybenzoate polyprenyltransferase